MTDAEQETPAPHPAARVLVIEDNRDAAESLQLLLEILGHPVDVAYDGPSGLTAARAARPDVVLCDVGLPGGMSGYQVAAVLRAELPGARLIAVTGYGRDEDVKRAIAAGFDQHLVKPVSVEQLQQVFAAGE